MKTTTIKTYLPVFPGFYGTLFEPYEENEIYNINEERENKKLPPISFDDCIFDYEGYHQKVSKECVGVIENEVKSIIKGSFGITFENLYSPREYNFTNDSINVAMEFDNLFIKNLTAYLRENESKFEEYLKENYSSRDGFICLHSVLTGEWIGDLQTKDNSLLTHKLGAILDFVLFNEGFESYQLHENIETRDCYASNYEELINN